MVVRWDAVDVGISQYQDWFSGFEKPVLDFPVGACNMVVGSVEGGVRGWLGGSCGSEGGWVDRGLSIWGICVLGAMGGRGRGCCWGGVCGLGGGGRGIGVSKVGKGGMGGRDGRRVDGGRRRGASVGRLGRGWGK